MNGLGKLVVKYVAFILAFFMLHTDLSFAIGDITVQKAERSKIALNCLAPQSNCQIFLSKEYGQKTGKVTLDSILKEGFVYARKQKTIHFLLLTEISSVIVNSLKTIVRFSRKLFTKPMIIILLVIGLMGVPAGNLFAQVSSDYVGQQYRQVYEMQINAAGGINDGIIDRLVFDVQTASDPLVQAAALKMLDDNQQFDELESIIRNQDMDLSARQEALLVRYNSHFHNLYFLADIVNDLLFADSTSDDIALCQFALTMAEGEILNSQTDLISRDMATASPETKVQLVEMLIRIIESNPNAMVTEYARELLFASFSNLELAYIIEGYVENDQAGLTSPLIFKNSKIVFANHNLKYLTKMAEHELERRIAVTILNDFANKAVTSSDFISSVVGKDNSYGQIFLNEAMNNQYQAQQIRQFLPAAYSRIQEDYARTLVQGDSIVFESIKQLMSVNSVSQFLSPLLHSSNENIRMQEMQRLIAHNANNNNVLLPIMVQLAATAQFPDVRSAALDLLIGSPKYLMQLYLYPNVLPVVKNVANQQLAKFIKDSRSCLVTIAQTDEVFRNGLITFFQNSTDTEMREVTFRIYLRSIGDPIALMQFGETLADLNLYDSELSGLRVVLQNEIKRMLGMEIARYNVAKAETLRRSAAIGVSGADETKYEYLLDALTNTESEVTSILAQYVEFKTEVNTWYKNIEDQVFPSVEQLAAQNRSFSENFFLGVKNAVTEPFFLLLNFIFGSLVTSFLLLIKKLKKTKRIREEIEEDNLLDAGKSIIAKEGKPNNFVIKNKMKALISEAEFKKDLATADVLELIEMLTYFENGYPLLTPQEENFLVSIMHTMINQPDIDQNKYTAAEKLYRLLLINITHREYSTSDGVKIIDSLEQEDVKSGNLFRQLITGKAFLDSEALNELKKHEDGGKIFYKFLLKSRKVLMVNNFISSLLQGISIVVFYILKQFFLLPQGWMIVGITVLVSMAISFAVDITVSVFTSQMFDKYLSSLVDKLGKNHNIIKSHLPKVYRMTTAETSRWGMFKMAISSVTIAVALFLIFQPLFLPFIGTVVFAWVWILFAGFTPKIGLHPRQTEYLKAYGEFNQKRDDYLLTGKTFDFEDNWKKIVKPKLLSFVFSSVLFISGLTLAISVFIPFSGMVASIPFLGISLMGYLSFFYSSYEFIRRLSEGIMHTNKLKKMLSVIKTDKSAITQYSWNMKKDKSKQPSADWLLKDAYIDEVKFEEITITAPSDINQPILAKQDLVFPRGKIVYVSAPSGAGKSTIAKVLGFQSHQQGGKIMLKLIAQKDKSGDADWQIDNTGKYFSFVEANADNFKLETLQEYIQYHPLYVAESNNVLSAILKAYKIQGPVLEDFIKVANKLIPTFSSSQIDSPFAVFSPGQRKRLALLISLFSRSEPQPSHIILDDFFSGLDFKSISVYLEYIRVWQERTGAGVIIFDVATLPKKYRDYSYSFTHGSLIPFTHIEKQHQILDVINAAAESFVEVETEKFIAQAPLDKLPALKIFEIVKSYLDLTGIEEIEKLKRKEELATVYKQEEAKEKKALEETIIEDNISESKEDIVIVEDKQEEKVVVGETISTREKVEYSLFQYLRKYSKTLPKVDITVEAVEDILAGMDLANFSVTEREAYLDISAVKEVSEKVFQSLPFAGDVLKKGEFLGLPENLQKEALFFRMRVDFLKYESVEKQWNYLQALGKSSKDEDKLFLAVFLESVPDFEEAYKLGVCPKYFNLDNYVPILFYGMFLGALAKTKLPKYLDLGAAVSNIKDKKQVASYFAMENKIIMHERFRELLTDIKVSNTNLPAVRNVSDYLHIVKQMVSLGYEPGSGFSKELFRNPPPTLKYKTDFLHKYNLPINSQTIKIIKMTCSDEENEVQVLSQLLQRSLSLLIKNNFLSPAQIAVIKDLVFSVESFKKDPSWEILNNVRLKDPAKFDFLCGKVIADLKQCKSLIKGLENTFQGAQKYSLFQQESFETVQTVLNEDEPVLAKEINGTIESGEPISKTVTKDKNLEAETKVEAEEKLDSTKKEIEKNQQRTKKRFSFSSLGKMLMTFIVVLFISLNFQGFYNGIRNLNSSNLPVAPFTSTDSSLYRTWHGVLNGSSLSPSGQISTYSQDRVNIVETWANVSDMAYTVRAENGGIVSYVRAPGAVQFGDILVRYVDPQLLASLQQAEAKYSQLLLVYQQKEALVNVGGISRVEFEEAKYKMEQAKSELRLLRNQNERMTIRAPHNGVFRFSENIGGVTSVISSDMYIQAGQVLGYVSADNSIISFEVETSQINALAKVSENMELDINGVQYAAEVLSIQGNFLRQYNTKFTIVCRLPSEASNIIVGESYPISFSYLIPDDNSAQVFSNMSSYNYFSAAGFVVFGEEVNIASPADGYISYPNELMVGNRAPGQIAIVNHDILQQRNIQRQTVSYLQAQYELAKTLVQTEINISSPEMEKDAADQMIGNRTVSERVAYQTAQAELNRLNGLVNSLSVSLPGDGNWIITDIYAHNKEFVSTAMPILKAVNADRLQIQANIGPKVIAELELGQTVSVLVDGGNLVEGIVARIERDELGYGTITLDVKSANVLPVQGVPVTVFISRDHLLDQDSTQLVTQVGSSTQVTNSTLPVALPQSASNLSLNTAVVNNDIPKAVIPLAVFGVFAGFSLFAIFKRKNKNNNKNDKLINFVCYLLLSGYCLKGKGQTLDLDDLWHVFRSKKQNRKNLLQEKLRLVIPDEFVRELSEKLQEQDIFYFSSANFAMYKEKHEFKLKQAWHIPLDALNNENNIDNPEDVFSWAKKWLQYVPHKIKNISSVDNVHEVLALDQQILCWLEDFVSDYGKSLEMKKDNLLNDQNDTQLKSYMDMVSDLAKLRMQILRKGNLTDKAFSEVQSHKIGKFLNRTKRHLFGETSSEKDLSILINMATDAGKTILFVQPQDLLAVRKMVHDRGLVIAVYSRSEMENEVFISNALITKGWDAIGDKIALGSKKEIDTLIADVYYPKILKISSKSLLADQVFKAASLLQKNPFCFSAYDYRQCWYGLEVKVCSRDFENSSFSQKDDFVKQCA